MQMKNSITIEPEIFESSFVNGTQVQEHSYLLNFHPEKIGSINIESGKIIACDPVTMHNAIPFLQKFPVGKFPVQLAIASFCEQQRTAYCRILFSDMPVKKWEFALLKNQVPISIFGKSSYTYGVDACQAIFIDEKANIEFNRICKKNNELWTKAFVDDAENNYSEYWFYNIFEFGKHNLASFSTGMGDGHYSTYIGFDQEGAPCRLLTDFGLVGWWSK